MLSRAFYLCFILLSLVGCGEQKKHPEGKKPLIVITSPDNPPFEFKDTAQGGDKVIGLEMDIIQKLAERLGRPVQVVETDFAGILPALQAGRADLAVATITVTDERRKSVDFSDPFYTFDSALLVSEDSSIGSEKDLSSKKLGVQTGSSHEIMAHNWEKVTPDMSVVSFNKIGALVQEVKNGRLQAILTEDTTAHKIAASTPGLKVVAVGMPGEPVAIAFPKGSPLVEPINKALKEMKEDIEQLKTKWFTK